MYKKQYLQELIPCKVIIVIIIINIIIIVIITIIMVICYILANFLKLLLSL